MSSSNASSALPTPFERMPAPLRRVFDPLQSDQRVDATDRAQRAGAAGRLGTLAFAHAKCPADRAACCGGGGIGRDPGGSIDPHAESPWSETSHVYGVLLSLGGYG